MLQQLISSIGAGPVIGIAVAALVIVLFVIGYLKAPRTPRLLSRVWDASVS